MVQVRYGENSPNAKKHRSEFRSTWEYATEDVLPGMPAQQIPTPLLFKQLDIHSGNIARMNAAEKSIAAHSAVGLGMLCKLIPRPYKMANSMEPRTSSNIHFHNGINGMVCFSLQVQP